MNHRHKNYGAKPAYPRIWLMTDARIDVQLLAAVQRLPFGSGIIFRHYHLDMAARRDLFAKVRRIARRRGHAILLAGNEQTALRWHADGFHDRAGRRAASRRMIRSAAVHNTDEIAQAVRIGAHLFFLSPIFATNSHPGARPLGRLRFTVLAKTCGGAVIALGGITKCKSATLKGCCIEGWAGIDAFKR